MATEIKIHRGDQIGGCITEIWTGKTRILIDFGEELPGSKNEEKFEFPWEERPVDAVFFTHYHGDHIGRFVEACQHTDVYMSELSREVLVNIHGYLAENLPKLAKWKPEEEAQLREAAEEHGKALNILNGERVHTFRSQEREAIPIGDICVTPVWVDHSAADACMFLIETEDKRILHTGDFRGHGIQGEGGKAMCDAVSHMREERTIDVLITEGTMMNRRDEKSYSEEDLFQSADRLFQEHKQVFLIISSTNLDSIQTFYRAAVKWKRPVYVYNGYLKSQLETLGKYANQRWDMPALENVEQIKAQSPDQLKDGFVAIIKANEMGMKLINRFGGSHPVVVYSMWPGYYLRGLDTDLCHFIDSCKEKGIPVYPLTDGSYGPLHTSGHASPELIEQVINAVEPSELLPIHTEDAWEFLSLNISQDLKIELQKRLEEEQMRKRDEAIAKGYSEEMDHRYLSDEALEKFLPLPGRHYHKFVELVKNHKNELAFCFRGNNKDQGTAIIYYKNHVAFAISAKGDVTFDFNHARYMEDWSRQKDELEKWGYTFAQYAGTFKRTEYKYPSGEVRDSYSIGTATLAAEQAAALTMDGLEQLYQKNIKVMIEAYFNAKQEGKYDYFRKAATGEERPAKALTEKIAQQKLFLTCKSLNGYFIYDMEFSQPEGKTLDCENQPDMLAIRFNRDGEPERLVFVEVKSKKSALNGMSGVRPHVCGMERYPDWLLPVRGRDAYHILEQYIKLGLIKEPSRPFAEAEFERLPKEALLFFTGQDTISALEKARAGGAETIKQFLLDMGYDPLYDFPEITLDGRSLPMEVYHKDFILKGAPIHGEA